MRGVWYALLFFWLDRFWSWFAIIAFLVGFYVLRRNGHLDQPVIVVDPEFQSDRSAGWQRAAGRDVMQVHCFTRELHGFLAFIDDLSGHFRFADDVDRELLRITGFETCPERQHAPGIQRQILIHYDRVGADRVLLGLWRLAGVDFVRRFARGEGRIDGHWNGSHFGLRIGRN